MNLAKQTLKVLDDYENKKNIPIINNSFFLHKGILCLRNDIGDARHPYVADGLTLWTHQNGKVSLNESDFFFLSETLEGESGHLAFFLGLKEGEGYHPYSLFEFNRSAEEKDVLRLTVFYDTYTLYILKKNSVVYSLRIGLDEKKELLLETAVQNIGKNNVEIYTSSFFDFMMVHGNTPSVETKWFRKVQYKDGLFTLATVEDLSRSVHLHHKGFLKRIIRGKTDGTEETTSRMIYANSKTGRIESSECLYLGSFSKEKDVTCFSDTAICGDLIRMTLTEGECKTIQYVFRSEELPVTYDAGTVMEKHEKEKGLYYASSSFIHFDFHGSEGRLKAESFTSFLKEVVKQVEYCATSKNSTLRMLGIRDCFQAIEGGVLFDAPLMRKMILRSLDYTGINGRLPRQYSYAKDSKFISIDARNFIDQGLWVIDAIYQYLAYTNDYSLLSEECGYIRINDDGPAERIELKENVYEHLVRIAGYLIANIDKDTSCLKVLYGDWNDAVDGLGKGKDDNDFGNGVSVMATFQLYRDLQLMSEIAEKADDPDKSHLYLEKRELIAMGIRNHAFCQKGNEVHIVHGWGNNRSFYVGSFDDADHKSRDALTSNAFYLNSGYYLEDPEYQKAVLKAYQRLDSKYGLKTFEPYFDHDAAAVGRIVNLPKGTAENGAVYIHGTAFAIQSLFVLNKPQLAWNQIEKIIPITHEFVTTTPFVMPNSYICNPEIDVDGESMSDWYTGSSNTLLKTLVRDAFGIDPDLDFLKIHPAAFFPFHEAKISLMCCSCQLKMTIISSERKNGIYINGKKAVTQMEGNRPVVKLRKSSLGKELDIVVYNSKINS